MYNYLKHKSAFCCIEYKGIPLQIYEASNVYSRNMEMGTNVVTKSKKFNGLATNSPKQTAYDVSDQGNVLCLTVAFSKLSLDEV